MGIQPGPVTAPLLDRSRIFDRNRNGFVFRIALSVAVSSGMAMRNLSQPDSDHAERPSRPAKRSLVPFRLRHHADFQRAYSASGRKRQSASMSWFLAPQPFAADGLTNQPAAPRVGLTAGKVLGKAHERNRIKRRLREALRRHVELLPAGCDLILHPRRSVLTLEFVKLESEIVRILKQAQMERVQTEQAQRIPAARSQAGGSAR
jgi:ribonuclease P protein component